MVLLDDYKDEANFLELDGNQSRRKRTPNGNDSEVQQTAASLVSDIEAKAVNNLERKVQSSNSSTPEVQIIQSSSSSEFHTANEDTLTPRHSRGRDSASPRSQATSGSTPSEYATATPGSTSLASLSSHESETHTLVHSDDEEEDVSSVLELNADVDYGAPGQASSRAVSCEARQKSGHNTTGQALPVTLTTSTVGSEVSTQVETTFESVRGEGNGVDNQDGRLMYAGTIAEGAPENQIVYGLEMFEEETADILTTEDLIH